MNCHWHVCGLNLTCNCCGIAATSVAPVKRYNDLVPDVFPKAEPPMDAPVDAATARKIKKLVEYVHKNPQRGPKVSRRLARRIGKALSQQRYGYVMLAVEAYSALLGGLQRSDCRMLARELIVQRVTRGGRQEAGPALDARMSVVGLLSRHPRADMRAAAARLFRQFTDLQDNGDYMPQLAVLAREICSAARGEVPQGEKTGINSGGGGDASACAAVAFRALDAYDSLVTRVSLEDKVFPSIAGALVAAYGSRPAATGNVVGSSEAHSAAAAQLAASIGSRTRAADGTSQRLATLLGEAARAGLWRGGGGAALLTDMRAGVSEPHQAWPLYEALVKHSSALPAPEQQAVLGGAVDLAVAHLPDAWATAALALLLREAGVAAADGTPTQAVHSAVRSLEQHCAPEQVAGARAALQGAGSSQAAAAGPGPASSPLGNGPVGDRTAAMQSTPVALNNRDTAQQLAAGTSAPALAADDRSVRVHSGQSYTGPAPPLPPAATQPAAAPPVVADAKTPEAAIAALDQLLAAHGVPAMQLQPPPGLIGAAA